MPSGAIPFPDSEFDLVFSDNVMEHLENPESVFAEVFRVLKPGGIFMAKTPNRKHYMPMISSITPKQFHVFYNGLRGRDESDTFPTYYRCNSAAKVRSLSAETGFLVQSIDLVESRPEYLRLTSITYIFGLLYERIVNYVELLAGLRCVLIFSLQKPDSTQTD
jgi:SAM-dependent methyltransferase